MGLALAMGACSASGDEVEGLTFGGHNPNPDANDSSDTALPNVTGGDETGSTGGDDGPSPASTSSTTAAPPSGECPPGAILACYDGPANTENVGECTAGQHTCGADEQWGACEGSVHPSPEVCNGLDDDCNAVVDDGNPGGGGPCTTGLQGPCADGTFTCSAGGLVCQPNVAPASAEVCGDMVDNDCNGLVDDNCAVVTPCDPSNPTLACGAGQHCVPSPTGQTTCEGPAGFGTQYGVCLSTSDCSPGFACIDTGLGTAYCMQWCTDSLQCSLATDLCLPLTPAVYAGAQEYGTCYDGLP